MISENMTAKLTFFRYVKATIMNWFNIRERNLSKEDQQTEVIRKKLVVVDKLRDYDIVIKKINEIDVLKRLLLNDEQLLCFDFLEKPLSLNTDNMFSRSFKSLVLQMEEKRKLVVEKFGELFYRNKDDIENSKLYHALDESVRNEIDKMYKVIIPKLNIT
jgi:hypothetical protein